MRLTDKGDWETSQDSGEKPIGDIPFTRIFSQYLPKARAGEKVLEIGCVPGNFPAYICKKFGYKPVGVDYLKNTVKVTSETMENNGISDFEVVREDFFNWRPKEKFSIVSSFGFIEHFTNPEETVKRHVDLLDDKGTLILEVPNFKGLRNFVARIIDKDFLGKHNLDTMDLEFYRKVARENNLEILYLGYYGGFAYFPKNNKLSIGQKLFFLPFRVFGKIFRDFPFDNKLLSSYVFFIAKKKQNNNA